MGNSILLQFILLTLLTSCGLQVTDSSLEEEVIKPSIFITASAEALYNSETHSFAIEGSGSISGSSSALEYRWTFNFKDGEDNIVSNCRSVFSLKNIEIEMDASNNIQCESYKISGDVLHPVIKPILGIWGPITVNYCLEIRDTSTGEITGESACGIIQSQLSVPEQVCRSQIDETDPRVSLNTSIAGITYNYKPDSGLYTNGEVFAIICDEQDLYELAQHTLSLGASFEENIIFGNSLDMNRFYVDADSNGVAENQFLIGMSSHYASGTPAFPFKGIVEGDRHIIKNFKYKTNAATDAWLNVGFIRHFTGPFFRNLALIDAEISPFDSHGSYPQMGLLIGRQNGDSHFENIYLKGKMNCSENQQGAANCGGMIGQANDAHMDQVGVEVEVQCLTSCQYVGGVVGQYQSSAPVGRPTIKNSYSTGDVTAELVANNVHRTIGGFAGQVRYAVTIEDSYSTGNVTQLSGTGHSGGFVGTPAKGAIIQRTYALGDVTSNSTAGAHSGFPQNTQVIDSYALGNVSANRAGGFVGRSYNATTKIIRSYAGGSVVGVVAQDAFSVQGAITTTDCYYNSDSMNGVTSIYATGLSSSQVKDEAQFQNWDFSTVWTSHNGSTEPKLRSIP